MLLIQLLTHYVPNVSLDPAAHHKIKPAAVPPAATVVPVTPTPTQAGPQHPHPQHHQSTSTPHNLAVKDTTNKHQHSIVNTSSPLPLITSGGSGGKSRGGGGGGGVPPNTSSQEGQDDDDDDDEEEEEMTTVVEPESPPDANHVRQMTSLAVQQAATGT